MRFLVPLWAASRRPIAIFEIVAVFIVMLVVYLIGLLVNPISEPSCADEFAYLFSAKLMATGRVSLPAEPDARFFQTYYILEEPVRMGRFHPGQSAALALGILVGAPVVGVLATLVAAMGFFYALLRIIFNVSVSAVFALAFAASSCLSYWFLSYWGGGVSMLGAMLFFYVVVYQVRHRLVALGFRLALLGVIGVVLLAVSRPAEGAMLVGSVLIMSFFRPRMRALFPMVLLAGVISVVVVLGYNYVSIGSFLTFPYYVYESVWCKYPVFIWQHLPESGLSPVGVPILDLGRVALTETDSWFKMVCAVPLRFIMPFAYVFGNCTVLIAIFSLGGIFWFKSLRWMISLLAGLLFVSIVIRAWQPHYAAPWFPLMMFVGSVVVMRAFGKLAPVFALVLLVAWFGTGGVAQYPESNVVRLMKVCIASAINLSDRVIVFVEPPDSPILAAQVVLDNPLDRSGASWLMVNLLSAGECDRFCAQHADRKAYVFRFLRTPAGVCGELVNYSEYRLASHAKFLTEK